MTFRTFVFDEGGNPIQGVLVTGNDMITGESFVRVTDGTGYADVAMLGNSEPGHDASVNALDLKLRYQGDLQYHKLGNDSTDVRFTLPFA